MTPALLKSYYYNKSGLQQERCAVRFVCFSFVVVLLCAAFAMVLCVLEYCCRNIDCNIDNIAIF